MANMMDYLLWRGDLLFEQAEFNEVDNLIFSELVYVDFLDIVPAVGEERAISLKEASAEFFKRHTEEEILAKVSSTKVAAFLMREMAKTKRFGDISLSRYIDDIDQKEQSQFCAMTIRLDDGSIFVAFSGTDNTIVGWRENFNMSFLEETPGQLKAVEYLNRTISPRQKKVRIGGHSKGGNLAVYASVYCKEPIQKRIVGVYSNDGPGFTEEMMKQDAYQAMLPNIHTYIPESSIVGMLLERKEAYQVIKSSASGRMQHDAMTWEVLGNSLVHLETVTEQSVLIDKMLKAWIGKLDTEQREEFVDTLFEILEEGEIQTIDDLANMKLKKFFELFKLSSVLEHENEEVLKKSLKLLLEEGNRILKSEIIPENKFSKKNIKKPKIGKNMKK
ncbi:MAG: DUF2974 domain-containing protein [Lachnospiraceae bacterium]|nr:DUF2974 domain-containing protein [Lachnospiraceae bacterium]